MTEPVPDAPQPAPPNWKRRFIIGAIVLVLLVIGYFVAAAFLPRWWAHRIGDQVNGTFHAGIGWGLGYGFVFMLVPLIVLRQAVRRGLSWKARGIIALVGVILSAPNLMTLGIAVGNGSGAHAGSRTMDTQAPGFRGATLIGVLIALAVFALAQYLLVTRARRRRELKALRAEKKARDAQPPAPPMPPLGGPPHAPAPPPDPDRAP